MFSNDRNIETIGQLVEVVKHYLGLQTEYVKLDVIEKVVRLLTVATITIILSALFMVIMIFLSLAAAAAIAKLTGGMISAWCIVALFYFIILILVLVYRKRLIERPLVNFLATLLMEK
ncbi:MAG: phage holin family protein [Prevotella sp.]|jgi:hypothetical protein|nr:phage holin family protein [Prevotella sp.]MCR5152826.1 phage holin family protein [Prevotella sp.]